jgi:Holliday junction resolvase
MGRFSRNKGKVGERELASELTRVLGVSARRGVQFQGGSDSPDVIADIPDLHIECKRTERFRLYEALDQAVNDAGNKTPIVIHRQNRQPWVAIIRLDDLPIFVQKLAFLNNQPNETEETNGRLD